MPNDAGFLSMVHKVMTQFGLLGRFTALALASNCSSSCFGRRGQQVVQVVPKREQHEKMLMQSCIQPPGKKRGDLVAAVAGLQKLCLRHHVLCKDQASRIFACAVEGASQQQQPTEAAALTKCSADFCSKVGIVAKAHNFLIRVLFTKFCRSSSRPVVVAGSTTWWWQGAMLWCCGLGSHLTTCGGASLAAAVCWRVGPESHGRAPPVWSVPPPCPTLHPKPRQALMVRP